MIDVNKQVRDILKSVEDVTLTYYHPEQFNKPPIISYYELATTTGLAYDNAEQGQRSNVQIDIWGGSGGECSRIAIQVDSAMQKEGWRREMSRDMPPENSIYHKTMRYYKHIFFLNERNDQLWQLRTENHYQR